MKMIHLDITVPPLAHRSAALTSRMLISRQDAVNVPPPTAGKSGSVTYWVRLIQQTWSREAGRTLELARLVSRARRSLPYGNWSRLWQMGQLPFSKRKGEMLVVIGEVVGVMDAQKSAHLPAAWNTLYCLARLGRATVEALIQDGRIHRALTLRQARILLAEHHPATQRKASCSKLKVRLARFAALVRSEMSSWTREDQDFFGRQLLDLAGEIQCSTRDAALHGPGLRPLNSRPFALFADPAGMISQTP